jgi:hypothetical protein
VPQSSAQHTYLVLQHPETTLDILWNIFRGQADILTSLMATHPTLHVFRIPLIVSAAGHAPLLEPPPRFSEGNVLIYSKDDGDLMPTSYHVRNILGGGGGGRV